MYATASSTVLYGYLLSSLVFVSSSSVFGRILLTYGTSFKIGCITVEPNPPTSKCIRTAKIAIQMTIIISVTKTTAALPPPDSSSNSSVVPFFFASFFASFRFRFSSFLLAFSAFFAAFLSMPAAGPKFSSAIFPPHIRILCGNYSLQAHPPSCFPHKPLPA